MASGSTDKSVIFGLLSLITWTLIVVVTVKYVGFMIRADNDGEGGVLSLMALSFRDVKNRAPLFAIGIFGAALFYGDALITPAISVLSATEGLKYIEPKLENYVVPITIGILVLLFSCQYKGTAKVSALFGPVTFLWFSTMGILGLVEIVMHPEVLQALSPLYAFNYLNDNREVAFVVIGAVFLAVTGVEALYADLGHFGRKPIQYAWLIIVLPCLLLNYYGQGALVLHSPEMKENPFYLLAPDWFMIPLVILATIATIVASQAVITGAYSLTQQAIQLGLLPRMDIRHTSEGHQGQIYLPRINLLLMIGVVILVWEFKSSAQLAAAYGLAVTGTMVTSSLLLCVVMRKRWKWPWLMIAPIACLFLVIEGMFLFANSLKLLEGGWLPLVIAIIISLMMVTWRRGSKIIEEKSARTNISFADMQEVLAASSLATVRGTAVFLTSNPDIAPPALMHNIKHNKVLHERNIILSVINVKRPHVSEEDRVQIQQVNDRFYIIKAHFGFYESPNLSRVLGGCRKLGIKFDIMNTSFFLGRKTLKESHNSGMPVWQDRLFISMSKTSLDATTYYRIPTERVVELGTQIYV